MSFDLDRYDDGYLLTLWPPMVETKVELRGLEEVDVRTELRERSAHPIDVDEAIWDADARFEHGTTDRSRVIRDIRRRVASGAATADDVDLIRQEIRAGTLECRRIYLIGTLYLAGQASEAIALLLDLLENCEAWDEVEGGLGLLAEWSPEEFERVAVRFIRGLPWDVRFARSWAMAYAGRLLERRLAPSLLDEIARVALDPTENNIARHDARNGIAIAAGLDVGTPGWNHLIDHGSDDEVRAIVEAMRTQLIDAAE